MAAEHHAPNPIHEVQDQEGFWPFFESLFKEPVGISLFKSETPISIFGYEWYPKITKFMLLELIAAGLILLIYIPLARRMRNGELPTGKWWNFWEGMLTFIRDEVARPNLDGPAHDEHELGGAGQDHMPGHHEPPGHPLEHEKHVADKFVPFLWTLFLFVLFCNLLGMFPMMGSP